MNIKAFRCTNESGGQYITERGEVIYVEQGSIITDADPEKMFYNEGSKKVSRFGFEVIVDYLPPATPLDVKLAESKRLKELSEENLKLKQKLEDASAKD